LSPLVPRFPSLSDRRQALQRPSAASLLALRLWGTWPPDLGVPINRKQTMVKTKSMRKGPRPAPQVRLAGALPPASRPALLAASQCCCPSGQQALHCRPAGAMAKDNRPLVETPNGVPLALLVMHTAVNGLGGAHCQRAAVPQKFGGRFCQSVPADTVALQTKMRAMLCCRQQARRCGTAETKEAESTTA
jgi:hypothetical protein